jgi:RNA polymerase sigma-70 factor (ECF subfamily)
MSPHATSLAPTLRASVGRVPTQPERVVPPPVLPAIAAGDDAATTELWDRYAGRVRALGLRLSGYDQRFADDLVQETFAKLWKSAAAFDDERGTEATFVFTVARRAAVDQWRRGRRAADHQPLDRVPEATGAITRGPETPEDHVDAVVTGWVVNEALATLSAPQREVVDLAYYAQLSQSEIADRLGIPLGTVKTRTHAAMRALRAALADKGVTA